MDVPVDKTTTSATAVTYIIDNLNLRQTINITRHIIHNSIVLVYKHELDNNCIYSTLCSMSLLLHKA